MLGFLSSFCWGCVGRGRGGWGEGWGDPLPLYRASVSWTQSWGRSCFCIQCELVFTDDFDNSGSILRGVCVSELFNFMLSLYEEIFMHTSPSVYLMLINITSSAMVSFESDSLGSTWTMNGICWAFMWLRRRKCHTVDIRKYLTLGHKKPIITSA